MSLVDIDDLSDYMSKVAFTSEQQATGLSVLAGVQEQLERYINRPLEPTLVQERVMADEDGFLQFSKTPVTELISITDAFGDTIPVNAGFESTALATNEYQTYGAVRQVDYVGGTFYGGSPINYGGFGANRWGPRVQRYQWFVVKYVACAQNFSVDDVKLSIMRVAAREMVRKHDDTLSLKEGIFRDETNPEITGINGFGFTQEELSQFDRMKRRVIV